MKLQRLCALIVLFIGLVHLLQAQPQQKLTLNEATVFLTGAELISSTKVNLAKGENEILFTNVANNIKTQSIGVNATNGVAVQSAIFRNSYIYAEVPPARTKEIGVRVQQMDDSMEQLANIKEELGTKITVIDEQIAVLQANRKVSGDNTGLSVAELTKMLDLLNARWETYLTQKSKLKAKIEIVDEQIADIKDRQTDLQKKNYEQGGLLLIKFYAKEATTSTITINYVIPNAGWSPTYDIWADNAAGPVKLYYKANISQNSGILWNNVHLTLSTGNPNESAQAPVIMPWHLAFYAPPSYAVQSYNKELVTMPTTQVMDLVTMQSNVYQQQRGGGVVTGGSRGDGTLYLIDGVAIRGYSTDMKQASIDNYVAVDNSGVNTTFEIDLPYTIPCDGQPHLVAIKEMQLPASYRYYAIPKLDKDVFLQAQVTKWEDLNLLPGSTNIFYEGTYVGQGMMDVRNIKDTMNISLGRDKKIIIKREQNTRLHSRKILGTNEKEQFAYTISLRNARKEPITLVLYDQLPVSNDAAIEIEDTETSGAIADEKTGILRWEMQLAGSETKKINFGFSVKYSRGKTVAGLR